MSRKFISLNDANWRVGSVAQKSFANVNDLADVREWLPAQIPGDVRLDLLRAGKIADPFFADNNEQSQWIDSHDWWYVRDLDLALEQDERAFLIFDGIDYQSAVFWNGTQLGRHAGMFSRQIYEIQSPVNSRHSTVAVRVWGSDALPTLSLTPTQKLWARMIKPLYRPPEHPYPDRYATLKCQMQFGWDFSPRLRTCGIWDAAKIVVVRSVFIEDAFIKAKVKSEKEKIARIDVTLTLDSDRAQDVRIECVVRGKNFADAPQTFSFDLNLACGKQTHTISFELQDARQWNPWDRGDPNLYTINFSLNALDNFTTTFGIRSFDLMRSPNSREPWQFVINGNCEFLRGANWVPLDAIPGRLTRADYVARLQQARDANINFLRVWGGGLREKSVFYDLCDELGILVWQEFPFAGALLDRFPSSRAHLDHIGQECGAMVRALRNHPSLVVWCGGNEFNTRGNRAIVQTLEQVAQTQDSTRPFKPASPYRDESHNWSVWHRFANLRDYRKDQTPFLSEFGLQALPNLESLKKFLPDEALHAPHQLWEYHHADLKKLTRYAHPIMSLRAAERRSNTCTKRKCRCPQPSEEIASSQNASRLLAMTSWIDATQRAQAFGLQIAIEHMRRRKPNTTGVAIWQLCDAAPAISWSVIDYYGTRKHAYYELAKLYSPVLASFDYPLVPRRAGDVVIGDLWLINDLIGAFENVELVAELNGAQIFSRRVNLKPNSSERIDSLAVTLGDGENILRLIARDANAILSDHEYDLNYCDVGEMGLIDWLMFQIGKRIMR